MTALLTTYDCFLKTKFPLDLERITQDVSNNIIEKEEEKVPKHVGSVLSRINCLINQKGLGVHKNDISLTPFCMFIHIIAYTGGRPIEFCKIKLTGQQWVTQNKCDIRSHPMWGRPMTLPTLHFWNFDATIINISYILWAH